MHMHTNSFTNLLYTHVREVHVHVLCTYKHSLTCTYNYAYTVGFLLLLSYIIYIPSITPRDMTDI